MKKRIINLFIAVLFTSFTALASTNPSISTDGSKNFVVDTKLWKSEFLSIEIINNKGEVIFEDEYTTINNKKFNFENLPNGSYSIIIENELKSTKQGFDITSNEIVLLSDEETTYKPVINIDGNHIDLNYLSNSKSTSINIYGNNENIYSVKIKDLKSINKRFNIDELPKGSYTFSVSSGGNIYAKRFKR